MSTMTASLGRSWTERKWARRLFRGTPFRLARFFMAWGMPAAAIPVLRVPMALYPPAPDLLLMRAQAARRAGRIKQAKALCEALRPTLEMAVLQQDLRQVLAIYVEFEASMVRAPLAAGRYLSGLLCAENRRKLLLDACADLPEQPFIIQIRALCQALDGEYKEAAGRITDLMRERGEHGRKSASKAELALLRETWTVVDRIAFANVDWAGDDVQTESSVLFERAQDSETADALVAGKLLHEQLLQSREQEKFLALCQEDFDKAVALNVRLNAIRHMLRVGLRRLPDYTPAHEQARQCLDAITPEIARQMQQVPRQKQLKSAYVNQMVTVLTLARTLRRADLAQRIVQHFVDLSEDPAANPVLWFAAANIANEVADQEQSRIIMDNTGHLPPQTQVHVRDYFRWANLVGAYDEARKFSSTMPANLKRSFGMIQFVDTLPVRQRLRARRQDPRGISYPPLAGAPPAKPSPHDADRRAGIPATHGAGAGQGAPATGSQGRHLHPGAQYQPVAQLSANGVAGLQAAGLGRGAVGRRALAAREDRDRGDRYPERGDLP